MRYQKKLDIFEWLFFLLYIIMPSYFAIEISSKFPLLTTSRLVLLCWLIFKVIRNKGKFRFSLKSKSLRIYFILMVIVELIHFGDSGNYAIKDLIALFMEQFLVFIAITDSINTKAKFLKSLKVLLYSSMAVSVVSLIGFFLKTNLFYLLNTVSREMLMSNNTEIGSRLGMIRIEAGFGHAIYYGMYCVVFLFVGMYFYIYEKKTIYLASIILNGIALLLTNSRGCILAFFITLLLTVIINKRRQARRYLKFIAIGAVLAFVGVLIIPTARNYVYSVALSIVISFFGSSTELAGYGANVNGASSRLIQFSGMLWTWKFHPIIGFGPSAHSRLLIKYFNKGLWWTTNTFDVGYVAIVAQFGLIGTIAHIALYYLTLKLSFNKLYKDDPIFGMFRNVFVGYFICMLSVVTMDKLFWVIFSLLYAYYKICTDADKEAICVI